ncbi:P-loop containing nucleoside triphosphate hydrolase protein [Ephemerocybe angulata]|uniref:P-loop containing nucleoside triphosphate hydrolase protein n=1 Tax=Ephemerocybe angulata TaxID=980116 RepID=A0A8H6M264_9AGAR|nr:P-loop containing nucleoside triphosphate hydrolase protein [Tulosesus angulatus]
MASSARRGAPQPTNSRSIIIPVMGATGAGKSHFINALLRETGNKEVAIVGSELSSCTVDLLPVEVAGLTSKYKALENEEVVVVDTPGFDDTKASDLDILKRIASWLKKACQEGAMIGGVIYIHDISQDRFSGSARKNLEMFGHLCGDAALHKVVLVTSKWATEGGRDFPAREKELRDTHWRAMLGGQEKARTMRFDSRYEGGTAVRIVDGILRRAAGSSLLTEVLQIQKELVKDKKYLPQTKAANALREQLEDMIRAQTEMLRMEARAAEGDEEAEAHVRAEERRLQRLTGDVAALRSSLGQRIKAKLRRMFGQ